MSKSRGLFSEKCCSAIKPKGFVMHIAICDDSKEECLKIKGLCEESGIAEHISYHIFTSGQDLLDEAEKGTAFDIVFLDVDMPIINGIETGKRLRYISNNCVIIFVTAHPEYAIDAFECQAFHYLLKPCSKTKLCEVLNHARLRLNLLKKYHVIKLKDRILSLPLNDICYIEYSNKYIIYHTVSENISERNTMQNVYESVRTHGFFLVHQGFIINMDKIKVIEKDEIVLQDNSRVPMSRRKKAELSIEYMKHVEKYKR